MKTIFFAILIVCRFVSAEELVDKVIVVINNEIVTESDLTAFDKKLSKNDMIDELLLFGQKPEAIKSSRQLKIDYLVNEKILSSEIKRLNLTASSEKIEQEIREIAKRNRVSRAELINAIKSQGMTLSDYQDFIRTRLERQSLIEQEITAKIRVSDDDVLAAYQLQNPKAPMGVYEYSLSHILFNPRKGGAVAAKERAESVLRKLKSGGVFDVLAEQHSEDSGFSNAGYLGSFKAGEFSSDMESAVRNLAIGSFSEVVQTKSGFHIFKLVGKKQVNDPKFDAEKERIRSGLFEKSFQKHLRIWFETKKDDGFVKFN